jgi:1-deoxy-D-xylulose-5-phosphate reductoisomerase
MKSLAIIGSTGSVGKSALEVFTQNKNKFNLLYLAANTNYKKLLNQKKKFKPQKILLLNKKFNLDKKYKNLTNAELLFKRKKKIDYTISGISGFDSLKINFDLIKISKNLLIANKESIICGNKFLINHAKKYNCNLIPIDSEHHCLDFFLKNFKLNNMIDKFFIMASGGPFLNKKAKKNEKIKSVINHPVWKMGKVISINSSTLSNKILELFEAKILFNIPSNKLRILIEQKSNFHVIIKLKNNIFIPVIHSPSMQIPISNALNLSNKNNINFVNQKFEIKKINYTQFPLVKLGYKILNRYDEKAMIVFTVLNDRLVNLYLNKKIKYGDIASILINTFNKKMIINELKKKIKNYKDVISTINFAKKLCF